MCSVYCMCVYTLCCVDSVNGAHLTRHSIPTCTKLSLYRQLWAFNFCLIRDVSVVWWHGVTVLLLCLQPGMFLVVWFDSPVTYSQAWDISGDMVWQSFYLFSSLGYFWFRGLTVLLLILQPGMFLVAWGDSPFTLSPVWNVSGGIVWRSCYLFSSLGCFWWHGVTVLLLCLQLGMFLVAWFYSQVTYSPAWDVSGPWFDSPVTLSPAWNVWWYSLTILLLCLKPRMFLVAWFDSPVTLSPTWVVSNRNPT